MLRRTLIIGSIIVVFVCAVVVNLAILDILSMDELRQSLGKIVSVIVVSVVAMLVILGLVRLGTAGLAKNANDGDKIGGS